MNIQIPALGEQTFLIKFNKRELMNVIGLPPNFNIMELNNNIVIDPILPEELNREDDDHLQSSDDER